MKIKAGFLIGLLLVAVQSAYATDLVVFSAAAMKGALEKMPAQYLAATGDHVSVVYGTAGQIHDRVAQGQPFDVVIVPPAPLASLVKDRFVRGGSEKNLVLVRLGAAVRTGVSAPQIGDEASFKQTLLDAPSIGMANPATGATSGVYLARLIDRLGIGGMVNGKIKYYDEGQAAMEAMARGEVSLGLGQISEITPVHGVTLIGAIPEKLQLKTIYAAGTGSKSAAPDKADALLAWLSGPALQASFKANGFDLAPAK